MTGRQAPRLRHLCARGEQLTIDATTGTPIRFAGGNDINNPDITATYDVSRVHAADFGH